MSSFSLAFYRSTFLAQTRFFSFDSSRSCSDCSRLRSRCYRFFISFRRWIRSRQSFPFSCSSIRSTVSASLSPRIQNLELTFDLFQTEPSLPYTFHRLPDILQSPSLEPLRLSPFPSRSRRWNDASLLFPPLYSTRLPLPETIR